MEGSSIIANDDAPVIKGHEQPRNGRMTELNAASDATGLAISFPPNASKTKKSEAGSCRSEERRPSTTPHRPTSALLATKLTDSSAAPKSTSVDTTLLPTAAQARQGSRDTSVESTNNNISPGLDTPDLSSPCQESTWSHYAGRLRNISQPQSPTVYTTTPAAAARSRATRESSPATSIRQATPATPSSSTFSFIASKMAALKAMASPSIPEAGCGNELIDLDIEAALFPGGASPEGQAFSPAAYKNLQMNAIGLLHRFQATYQSQTIEFRTLQAEKEALEDEKSEAQTRAQHSKLQLEEVARKANEKEAAMQACIEELQRENRSLTQERQSRISRIAPSVVSTLSEDLGAEEDQSNKMWRRSGDTFKTETGSDTDEESVADASIFSRSRSPTMATTISEISPSEPVSRSRLSLPAPSVPAPSHQKPQQMTAFRKLMKGISGEAEVRIVTECSNCQGQDASVAWDTASLMRDENRGLKGRVTELESALEGALDVVNGLQL